MAVYTETIVLEDQVSGPAEKAERSVGSLAEVLGRDLGEKLRDANGRFLKTGESMGGLGDAIKDAQSPMQSFGTAAGSGVASGRSFGEALQGARDAAQGIAPHLEAAAAGLKSMGSALVAGDVGGAIEGLGEALAGVAGLLDLVVPGLGQAVGTIIKIGAGVAGLAASIVQAGMEFAIASATGKKEFIDFAGAMLGSAKAGIAVDDMLGDLSNKIGIAKDTLEPITAQFIKMGVTGTEALEKLTLAAISAEAIHKGFGDGFTTLIKKVQLAAQTSGQIKIDTKFLKGLNESGLTVDDLATSLGVTAKALQGSSVNATKLGEAMQDALIKKGAGPLDRMSTSIENLKKKFMSDLGDIFEDIDVAPFLAAIKDLFGVFSANSGTGETLKAGIQSFFQKTFDIATKIVPMVKHFFQDLIILGLKSYIALKPMIGALEELYTSLGGNATAMKFLSDAWTIMKPLLIFTAVTVGLVVGSIIALGMGFMWLTNATMSFLTAAGTLFLDWATKAGTFALDFITGLVNGITGGAAWVYEAIKGLATGALAAFKGVLGIASPSKVMMELGMNTTAGFTSGMEDGAPDVYGSAASVSGAAVSGASGGAAAATSTTTNAPTITVNVTLSGDGKSATEITREMISAAWEAYALGTGV